MNINKLEHDSPLFPKLLRNIPQPPQQIYVAGEPLQLLLQRPRVAIVGSRRITVYGRQVTIRLARELAQRGIVIVSGLAYGVDAVAHKAALDAGGSCIAVLPSPLTSIVPTPHIGLARRIIESGGTLVSEYGSDSQTHKGNFVERNRLMSGLADAVLITEAALGSGSLHTADFAADQGVTVLAVPGNITSPMSAGTNKLIKDGVAPVSSYLDVLSTLKIDDTSLERTIKGRSKGEQSLIDLLRQGVSDVSQLQLLSGLDASRFNQAFIGLEVNGMIQSLGANHWSLS